MSDRYRTILTESYDGFRAWQVWPTDGTDPSIATLAKIAQTGDVPFFMHPEGASFTWLCPGCGNTLGGTLGNQPVSGWESPRWQRLGSADKPTLTPSLGCTAWRNGICTDGHWWLRDGELVRA